MKNIFILFILFAFSLNGFSQSVNPSSGVSNAQLDTKVDKVTGKQLSTNDYSTAEQSKLTGIATGATANSTDANLRDRTTHTGLQPISTVTNLQTSLDDLNSNKQNLLNGGTGFVRSASGTISYDATQYLPLTGGTLTGALITNGAITINSTTAGLLIPRMTSTQRLAITPLIAGLQVYDTSINKIFIFDGTIWGSVGAMTGSFSQTVTAVSTFTVTIGTTMPNTTYKVNISSTSSTAASPWYISNKTTTSFDVIYQTTLTGVVSFDYSVFR